MQNRDGRGILAELVHVRTYAAVKPNGRKETREETISRVVEMHQTKFPWLADEIAEAFEEVYAGRVMPSMRSMQFAGYSIWKSQARIYNCSYAALQTYKDFADLFWLLLNGVGVGYSVQRQHVEQLPAVTFGNSADVFVIPDTKEGWADTLLKLLENPSIQFDYSKLRPKGAPLTTGGASSGPESLQILVDNVRAVLLDAVGRKLTPLECFDIMCHVADIIVVGSVRRAATIALFDGDDEEMLTAKHGSWWQKNPQRARANISAVVDRKSPDLAAKIEYVVDMCFASDSGEPGVVLSSDPGAYGYNPCLEISLRHRGLCNLTEVNAAACKTPEEFLSAARSASIIGTLQATYTDFEYLHEDWRKNAEKDALLGVSITGQAEAWSLLTNELLKQGAHTVMDTNMEWATKLEILPAARLTCTKPSGSSSAWVGTTSGIHAAHANSYLRRVRVDKKDLFGQHLMETYGVAAHDAIALVTQDAFNPENIVVTIPVQMDGAITRYHESAIDLLNRAKHIHDHWIKPGHVEGPDTHNVSLTVNYTEEEKEAIKAWMVANSESWAGISLLPFDGGSYIQAPFEEVSEHELQEWLDVMPTGLSFQDIDFSDSVDKRMMELACAGGSCEIT